MDASIEAAARLMDHQAVGAVIVVDGDRPVGRRDRPRPRRSGLARRVPFDGRIDSVMSPGVVVLDADADVRSAIAIVRQPSVPAPARSWTAATIVGMVTVDDLVVALSRMLGELTTGVTAQLLFGHAEPTPPVPA